MSAPRRSEGECAGCGDLAWDGYCHRVDGRVYHHGCVPVPGSAADRLAHAASEDLTRRLGFPQAGERLPGAEVVDEDALETPEAAAAFAAGSLAVHVGAEAIRLRDRVQGAVIAFLRRAERDWQNLEDAAARSNESGHVMVGEAKALHDAQLVELFSQIGLALPPVRS